MNNPVTVAQYPKSEIQERYIRIRELKELCLICQTLDKPSGSAQR